MVELIGRPGLRDVLLGTDSVRNDLYGDFRHMYENEHVGGNDILIGRARALNRLYGEAGEMDAGKGGHDHLFGGAWATNWLFGEAGHMWGGVAGNDTLVGGYHSANIIVGDVGVMEVGEGGNDRLVGGGRSTNYMYGDAGYMGMDGRGGNDTLIGGYSSKNVLHGDCGDLYSGVAGNDRLVGGVNGTNWLYGDAEMMMRFAAAGDDVLVAGDFSVNHMFGDVENWDISCTFGNDRLISGTGTDHMYGDAANKYYSDEATGGPGSDTFVFRAFSGNDFIYDFDEDLDKIEVQRPPVLLAPKGVILSHLLAGGKLVDKEAYGFKHLTITEFEDDTHGASSVVAFDSHNSVTVYGVTGLSESDFLFT